MRRIAAAAGTLLLCALALAPSAGARRTVDHYYTMVSIQGRHTESHVHDEFKNDDQICDWSSRVTTEYTLDQREVPGTAELLFPAGGYPPYYELHADLRFRITDSSVSSSGCDEATSCSGSAPGDDYER